MEVPKLPEDDAFRILSNWLSNAGRTLSKSQESIVNDVLQKCSLPIFIRVAFDEAIRWKSYSLPCETVLQDTVRGNVFNVLEKRFPTDSFLLYLKEPSFKMFTSSLLIFLIGL